ncbi:MAG: AzlD domain-containing protein [Lachnospiraceae bacterium]|nr:AzlD domain-containing protein [Lachnospiraceae bacterium]
MREVYLYIIVMALVIYAIRAVPLVLIRGEIKNPFLHSFLHYVPYVTLAALTFPSILTAADTLPGSVAGFVTATVMSLRNRSLLMVAAGACLAAYLTELIVSMVF